MELALQNHVTEGYSPDRDEKSEGKYDGKVGKIPLLGFKDKDEEVI